MFDPGSDFDYLAVGETTTQTITYTVSDGNGGTGTATVTVTITGSNDGPTAVGDLGTVDQDATVNLDLLDNDSDPDTSDTLTVTQINGVVAAGVMTLPSGATVTVNGDGTVNYDPGNAFDYLNDTQTATDSFSYNISDGHGGTDNAVVTVTINGSDDPTVTVADVATTNENSSVIIDVLGNDSDPDTNDNPLTVANVSGPPAGQGTVTNNTTNVTFNPGTDFDDLAAGESEVVTFTYTTNTGAIATVTVTVTGTNDGPVAVNDTGAVDEDNTLTVGKVAGVIDSNDTDLDASDVLTVTNVRTGTEATGTGTFGIVGNGLAGTYGTLTLADDGSYNYSADQPAADALALGVAATDVFTYTISDGKGGTATANLAITVTGTNDAPTAVADAESTDQDNLVNVNLLGNDTDPDASDTLTLTQINGIAAGGTITLPSGALLTVKGDGTVDYDPNGKFDSLDETQSTTDSFTYIISDGKGGTSTATATITINGLDDITVIAPDSATTSENASIAIDVLANDSDVDDTLTVASVSATTGGGTVTNNTNNVTFNPGTDFDDLAVGESRQATFTYTTNTGATETVTVTVTGSNDGPVANPDTASTDEDAPTLNINLLGNDTDPDGDTLAIVSSPSATNGIVTVNGDGTLNYTPNANFNGTDTITYTITDPSGATSTSMVTVTVNPVNDAPLAVDDSGSGDEDTAISGNVLTNDTDIDNVAADLSVVANTNPANGSVVVNADGSYVYTPNANFNGTDSFTYTVSDGNGGTDTATVNLTVNPVNDAPVANGDTGAVTEDATLTVNKANGLIDSNDTDPDGDTLTITTGQGTTTGTYGTLILATDGSYSYAADQAAANALSSGQKPSPTPSAIPFRMAMAAPAPLSLSLRSPEPTMAQRRIPTPPPPPRGAQSSST